MDWGEVVMSIETKQAENALHQALSLPAKGKAPAAPVKVKSYLEQFSENLTINREDYLYKIFKTAINTTKTEEDAKKFHEEVLKDILEKIIPMQSKLYACMEKDDVESIIKILENKNFSVLWGDFSGIDKNLRQNPLFHCITLLDNAPSEESFSKRFIIFCLMLNHRETKLLGSGDTTEEQLAKMQDGAETFLARQNMDETQGPETNLIKFLMNYQFKRKDLRKRILMEASRGNRSQEFQKCLADTSLNNILSLALKTGDVSSVEYLVSQGAKFEEQIHSMIEDSGYVPGILFLHHFDKPTTVGLVKAVLPCIRSMNPAERTAYLAPFRDETPTSRFAEILSLLIPAIKNGHFLPLLMFLDAFKIEDRELPFFRDRAVMAVICDSMASDEDISAFMDYVSAINCDSKEAWDVSLFNQNYKIRTINVAFENDEFFAKTVEQSCLHNLAANSKLKTLERLLAMGADPNLMTKGDSLLHLAARKENLELIKLLLRFKASPML